MKWLLGIASAAAVLASACCVLPLLLVSVGAAGAWMVSLRVLRPYSTALLVLCAGLVGFLWFCVIRRASCSSSAPGAAFRAVFWSTAALLVIMVCSPIWAPWFY